MRSPAIQTTDPVEAVSGAPRGLHVVMTFHDDWLVNILLSDGRIYTYQTETFHLHGRTSNFKRVVPACMEIALDDAARNSETWAIEAIPETVEQFKAALDFVCQRTSDEDFRRYVRKIGW